MVFNKSLLVGKIIEMTFSSGGSAVITGKVASITDTHITFEKSSLTSTGADLTTNIILDSIDGEYIISPGVIDNQNNAINFYTPIFITTNYCLRNVYINITFKWALYIKDLTSNVYYPLSATNSTFSFLTTGWWYNFLLYQTGSSNSVSYAGNIIKTDYNGVFPTCIWINYDLGPGGFNNRTYKLIISESHMEYSNCMGTPILDMDKCLYYSFSIDEPIDLKVIG